jgi:hypothetical protein
MIHIGKLELGFSCPCQVVRYNGFAARIIHHVTLCNNSELKYSLRHSDGCVSIGEWPDPTLFAAHIIDECAFSSDLSI